MPRVSLREFLATGRFGPVQIGSSRDAVRQAFGPPDDRDARAASDEAARIWKYGDIEFHFDGRGAHGSLWLIQAEYFVSVPRGGPAFDLDPWILSGALGVDAAAAELTKAGIAFASGRYEHDSDCDEVRTSVGVSLLFSGEQASGPGGRVLVAMRLSSSRW